MAEIFICYRREDSEGYAGRLHDVLEARFGAHAIFFDVDALHPGVDFDKVIQSTLGRCRIVLVIIGPGFFSARLRHSDDYVRREIVAALGGRKRVIPVLVGGATIPARAQVPGDVAKLLEKNAVTLRHAAWKHDVERLIRSLEKVFATRRKAAKPAGSEPAGRTGPKPATRRTSSPVAKRRATSSKVSQPQPAEDKPSTRARGLPKKKDASSPAKAKRTEPKKNASGSGGAPQPPRTNGAGRSPKTRPAKGSTGSAGRPGKPKSTGNPPAEGSTSRRRPSRRGAKTR